MKVIVAVILVLSSVSAHRSGPYLPSGWKPLGPFFDLPSSSSETSSSDALSEYGSPECERNLNINQDLPGVDYKERFNSEVTNDGNIGQEVVNVKADVIGNDVINIEETSEATQTEEELKEIMLPNVAEEYIGPVASGEFVPLSQQELQQVTFPSAFTKDFFVPIDVTRYETTNNMNAVRMAEVHLQ